MLIYIASAVLFICIVLGLIVIVVYLKQQNYELYQSVMKPGDVCLRRKSDGKYQKVKIREVYSYNVMVEDANGTLIMAGRPDIYPIDF